MSTTPQTNWDAVADAAAALTAMYEIYDRGNIDTRGIMKGLVEVAAKRAGIGAESGHVRVGVPARAPAGSPAASEVDRRPPVDPDGEFWAELRSAVEEMAAEDLTDRMVFAEGRVSIAALAVHQVLRAYDSGSGAMVVTNPKVLAGLMALYEQGKSSGGTDHRLNIGGVPAVDDLARNSPHGEVVDRAFQVDHGQDPTSAFGQPREPLNDGVHKVLIDGVPLAAVDNNASSHAGSPSSVAPTSLIDSAARSTAGTVDAPEGTRVAGPAGPATPRPTNTRSNGDRA